jgi:predicted nucleic acid-binding protein
MASNWMTTQVGFPCLSERSAIIVVDASIVINLNATQCAPEILRALPVRLAVVDVVLRELEEGREKGRPDADMLNGLAASGLLDVVALSDTSETAFERLVVGPANSTLDDGEAATIAYALEHALDVVVDDNKARRICKEQFPGVRLHCTCDILLDPTVEKNLGRDGFTAAVLNALRVGRMRVPPEHLQWVIELIGKEAASKCLSLPKKQRL